MFTVSNLPLKAIALSALFSVSTAHAAIDFTATSGGGGGGNNFVFQPCPAPIIGPALTTQGCLNSDNSKLISTSGNENLVLVGGGQARVEASDGAFTFLKIDPTNFSASDFIFNINTVQGQSGTVVFSDLSGSSSAFAVAQGSNFFTITGLTTLDFINITATGFSIQDVRQIRVVPGTDIPVQVPLPGALSLLGLGLAGLAVARKVKKSK